MYCCNASCSCEVLVIVAGFVAEFGYMRSSDWENVSIIRYGFSRELISFVFVFFVFFSLWVGLVLH